MILRQPDTRMSTSGAHVLETSSHQVSEMPSEPLAQDPEELLQNVLRDFISRAFNVEVAIFPERIQMFMEANERRIQQSVGDTSWS